MRPRLILVSILVAVMAGGCGLPANYFLSPPATPATLASPIGTPYFQIISTTANSESEFRGFALYYKLYSIDETIESGFGYETSESALLNPKGFLPVCSKTDLFASGHTVPLIYLDPNPPTDKGQEFTITIDFNSPADAKYAYTGPVTMQSISVGVCRSVADGLGGFKTFDPTEFLSTDSDISRIWTKARAAGSFYLAMYALSYGLQDRVTPIWSWPVYLGYVEIRF